MKTKLSLLFFVILLLFTFSNPSQAAVDLKGNDLEIILDVSGSMAQTVEGKSKIQIAKDALNSVTGTIPDGSYVGFRAYGHRYPTSDKTNSCKDSELVYPIGPIDKAQMTQKINSLQPKGWTPIDYSLRKAKEDFSSKAEYGKMVILVSDGEETCGGDPCAAVKELNASGFKMIVNTVGFDVDAKTEAQLRCIAEATGGEYKSAKNANDLIESLRFFSTRAFEGYKTAGGVKPGAGFVDAPLVEAGDFGGDILPEESKFWKLNVKKGQEVIANVNFRKEQVLSDDNFCFCMNPSLKINNKYKSAVAEKVATGCHSTDSVQGIKGTSLGPVSYSTKWKADVTGEVYISISNSWMQECGAGWEKYTNEREKKKKSFYDLVVGVEGKGEEEQVPVLADPIVPTVNEVKEDASAKPVSGDSSEGQSVWILILASVFLLSGIGAGIFFMLRRKRNLQETEIFDASVMGSPTIIEKVAGNDENVSSQPTSSGIEGKMPEAEITKDCPYCGNKNTSGAQICSRCGKPLV